ncbi:MAG TPA: hypothetical protein VIS94_11365 [Desulfomonilia bacterium]
MKRIYLVLVIVLCLGLVACGKNTAVITTSDLTGTNGQVVLLNTDDLTQPPVTFEGLNGLSPQVIVSPDGSKAYVCQAPYPNKGSDKILIIDLITQARTEVTIKAYPFPDDGRSIWDMALSADGTKLVVGTWSVINGGHIEVYDTSTLGLTISFKLFSGLTDPYKFGNKLVLDPKHDVVYVITTTGIIGTNPQVRGFNLSNGSIFDSGKEIESDEIITYGNYDIAVAPQGDLLLAVSKKIFPFKITDTGLEALNPIEGKSGDTFYGKTKILFSKNWGRVYVNSAGFYLPLLFNLGGSAYCLDKAKILANDPNPYVFSLVDFVHDDLIKWIVGLLSQDIENIIDPAQLYGIADSAIEGDTCYMVIASVASTALDLTGLQGGKYILAIFKTLPLVGNVWVGGKIIDWYPSNIGVNPANNTLILSYFWRNQVGVYKRNPVLGWPLTSEKLIDIGNYPRALDISTQKNQ